jgi:putative ABC transport system permease protein
MLLSISIGDERGRPKTRLAHRQNDMTGLWRRVLEVVRGRQLDRESAEELTHHVEMLVAHKLEGGISEAEARRQARLEVGSIEAAREQIAVGRTGFALEQFVRETNYAARVLRRSFGVSVLSVMTMGVGIGVSTILFALVNGIVLQPLAYPEPDRLVRIFDTNLQAGIDRAGAASGNIDDWRRRASSFEGIAGYYAMGRTLSTDAESEVLITAQVSEDFFSLMRVPPIIGQPFSVDETQRAQFSTAVAPIGADPVVMLSYAVWQQRFGGDPGILGRTVRLERRPFRIVGVMPEGFAMPDRSVRLWIPWDIAGDEPRDQHYLGAIARLKAGVSLAQAEKQLNGVARELGLEHPATNRGWGVRISSLAAETIGSTATVLWVLLAAVGLVLLVVCANVALLSLMRGLDRSDETAVRLALGASSASLIREFLMESVLLAAIGGVLGAAIAAVGLRVLPALRTDLPRLDEVALDYRSLLFIAAVTTLSTVMSGLPQAWRRTRVSPVTGLSGGSLRATDGLERHVLRDSIVVIQVAMAVVLMTGSGLLLRSYLHLRSTDPGFDPRGVLVAPIFLDSQAYTSGERSRTYYQTLFDRLSAIPGVLAVGGATTVPTSPLGPDFERPVWPEGTPADPSTRMPASVRVVTPGYFRALSLRLADGRSIDDRDQPTAAQVVMVNETLARRIWPSERAVGKQLVVDYSTAGTYPYEVIGVVGDMRFRGPRSEPLPEIYFPHAQKPYLILNVVLKSHTDPRALIPAVRAVLKDVDPQKPAHGLYPLEDLVGATYARDRQTMITLLVFAGTTIFLAVLSVYSVLSQRVRERSREIGIRMAMGASRSSLVGWVAKAGLRLLAFGVVAGLLAAWPLSSALEGLLFGVKPTDAITVLVVVAGLAAVGLLATLSPCWQATRIDPVVILRRG